MKKTLCALLLMGLAIFMTAYAMYVWDHAVIFQGMGEDILVSLVAFVLAGALGISAVVVASR